MSSAAPDPRTDPGPARVREVSDGVFAYIQPDGSWFINNTGFLTGRDGVISVDTCSTERRTRAYLAAIARASAQPVRTLVNTHHHGDHTQGNCLLPGATIVAHDRCREEILAAGPPGYGGGIFEPVDWGAITPAPPFLTYADGVTLYSDDLRCEVRYVGGPAHTSNDSVVWIPERSVLFAGDLIFNGGTPFVLMGSVAGAVDVLENVIRPLAPRVIVPGHGDVCGAGAVEDAVGYLRFVLETARRARAAGLAPLAAARETDLGWYASLTDPERIVGNLHRAYADLDAEAAGGDLGVRLDYQAILSEMVAYNGGKPLTCLA